MNSPRFTDISKLKYVSNTYIVGDTEDFYVIPPENLDKRLVTLELKDTNIPLTVELPTREDGKYTFQELIVTLAPKYSGTAQTFREITFKKPIGMGVPTGPSIPSIIPRNIFTFEETYYNGELLIPRYISFETGAEGVWKLSSTSILYGPWESVAMALERIGPKARFQGLTVAVLNPTTGTPEEWWFRNGIGNQDFVLKVPDNLNFFESTYEIAPIDDTFVIPVVDVDRRIINLKFGWDPVETFDIDVVLPSRVAQDQEIILNLEPLVEGEPLRELFIETTEATLATFNQTVNGGHTIRFSTKSTGQWAVDFEHSPELQRLQATTTLQVRNAAPAISVEDYIRENIVYNGKPSFRTTNTNCTIRYYPDENGWNVRTADETVKIIGITNRYSPYPWEVNYASGVTVRPIELEQGLQTRSPIGHVHDNATATTGGFMSANHFQILNSLNNSHNPGSIAESYVNLNEISSYPFEIFGTPRNISFNDPTGNLGNVVINLTILPTGNSRIGDVMNFIFNPLSGTNVLLYLQGANFNQNDEIENYYSIGTIAVSEPRKYTAIYNGNSFIWLPNWHPVVAQVDLDGLLSKEDKIKLDGLDAALSGKQDIGDYATLVNGLVPSTQLPSYVDDVLEFTNSAALPNTGETGKIYVTLNNNKIYRWSGSTYIEISPSPGSTDAVAEGFTNLYFTNTRAAAAAPVQSVAGKTGAVTLSKNDVGLSNVDNTSDADKPISTATQTALNGKLTYQVTNRTSNTNESIQLTGQRNQVYYLQTYGFTQNILLPRETVNGVGEGAISGDMLKIRIIFAGDLGSTVNILQDTYTYSGYLNTFSNTLYTITNSSNRPIELTFLGNSYGGQWAEDGKAPLLSPTFTGTPAAPTAAVDTNSTQVATTAFVAGQAGSATPLVDGTAAVGTSLRYARQDHVHPTDTTRAAIASPTFTGTPAAPTAAVGTNTTQLATTAYVIADRKANAPASIMGSHATGLSVSGAGQTYYFGFPNDLAAVTVLQINERGFKFPYPVVIIAATATISTQGTLAVGPGGNGSFAIYNKSIGAASTLLTIPSTTWSSSAAVTIASSGLSISLGETSDYVFQLVTPTFSTPPTSVRNYVTIYFVKQ